MINDDDFYEVLLRLEAAESEIRRLKQLTQGLTPLSRPSVSNSPKREKTVPSQIDLSKIVPFRKDSHASDRLGSSERIS